MHRQIIANGMKNVFRRIRRPVVALEFVTGVTAVHPVIGVVQTTLRARLKVIDGQFRSHITLADSAVAATEFKSLPQPFSLVRAHRLRVRVGIWISGEHRCQFLFDHLPFGLCVREKLAEPLLQLLLSADQILQRPIL